MRDLWFNWQRNRRIVSSLCANIILRLRMVSSRCYNNFFRSSMAFFLWSSDILTLSNSSSNSLHDLLKSSIELPPPVTFFLVRVFQRLHDSAGRDLSYIYPDRVCCCFSILGLIVFLSSFFLICIATSGRVITILFLWRFFIH